ncbi:hypothetical protein [Bradyrhizobium sp. BWA-3-5]|uniref:hypothetical protein n=1 Tax=Bradyrhizobium sp. BWA-3-5 TaxID=3080013 RepID=UPI00293F2F92|nr:hypothetical protein [Bradyrhizobium sp. BWA-3-5]WOH63813.1 hypothetical protein RX331_24320 [Bradyrhizobium sp. BWA-3-5]
MIYIYGLLKMLLELDKVTLAKGRCGDIAQQRLLEAIKVSDGNVVYVNFKGIRQAEEGA